MALALRQASSAGLSSQWPQCWLPAGILALHQDLWRLKIDKGGRILFEVAVEFIETERRWWVLGSGVG
jgi:hypothetical protein